MGQGRLLLEVSLGIAEVWRLEMVKQAGDFQEARLEAKEYC